jgi:predicted membrane channel-forming protein YqfA (hemolysin III family)
VEINITNITPLDVLFYVALGLLLLVSGGIIYLTSVEWRDRRRQSNDKRLNR